MSYRCPVCGYEDDNPHVLVEHVEESCPGLVKSGTVPIDAYQCLCGFHTDSVAYGTPCHVCAFAYHRAALSDEELDFHQIMGALAGSRV